MKRSLFPTFLLSLLSPAMMRPAIAAPVPVKWMEGTLTRDGKPYFIKGAGGSGSMKELAARGGNSLRTWGDEGLAEILESAEALHLTVAAGIWMEPECAWFSYREKTHCDKQTERIRKIIRTHREAPALLAWGLGNEAEGDGNNTAFWQQLGKLAIMARSEDPAHPCFTAVAGITAVKAAGMNEHAPALDFVGINTYGALPGLRRTLAQIKWARPWVVTEYGPRGFWESPRTTWGAPLEQTSTEKAAMFSRVYPVIAEGGACGGGYAFLWGQKQEATATWFGLLTKAGLTTPAVDALQEAWTGHPPANRAPVCSGIRGLPPDGIISPGAPVAAEITASDPEDQISVKWSVFPAAPAGRDKNGAEIPPPEWAGTISASGLRASFTAPDLSGSEWRLYVTVTDGKGHAALANVPFRIR